MFVARLHCVRSGTGGIFEPFPRYLLFGLNPLRRQLAFFVGAIHGECGHYDLLPEPPDAEAVARKIAAMDDLFRAGSVAPKLIGEIEDIGKEIRHVPER